MNTYLEKQANGYCFYYARRAEFSTHQNLPFYKSTKPLEITSSDYKTLQRLGTALAAFMAAVTELYAENEIVREILNHGKPNFYTDLSIQPNYLFYRPDLLYTDEGFKICEVETSPFGLGLSVFLDNAYQTKGFETIGDISVLKQLVTDVLPKTGVLLYSEKTKAYRDQLQYLVDTVFPKIENKPGWKVLHVSDPILTEELSKVSGVYRGFYLSEYMHDAAVQKVIEKLTQATNLQVFPSLTPFAEEKAILGLLWDKRFDRFFTDKLGNDLSFLRSITPQTSNFGHSQHCLEPLPTYDIQEFATLSRKERQHVLKVSGFGESASWGEGVHFLHKKSQKDVFELLQDAYTDQNCYYILQKFVPGKKVLLEYIDDSGSVTTMNGRLRITPYYDTQTGSLLTVKATARENTDFIHASSDSVNMPLTVREAR